MNTRGGTPITSERISALPTSGRPFPAASQDTRFFWDGARTHQLLIQHCADCLALRHPPGPACYNCRSHSWDTVEASGKATLYSYTVQRRPQAPGFDGPALVALVELAEGVRLLTNLDARLEELRIGQALEVFFLDQEEGWTVPQFRIAPENCRSDESA